MLDKNPETRISAREVLCHPYFLAPSVSMECIDEVKDNIRIYNKYYKKDFDFLDNQCLIRQGMENFNQKNIDSLVFFNKNPFTGKTQTIEKMSQFSNLSIKLDSPRALNRSLSVSKICRTPKSGDVSKILMNTFSSNLKRSNMFEAMNYINLLGENKKVSGDILIKNEEDLEVNQDNMGSNISGGVFDEKKTNGKLDEMAENYYFAGLIDENMK